jgi:HSP20 family protein
MTGMTRWQPFREFASLQDRVNRLFSEFLPEMDGNLPSSLTASWFSPKTDVYEEDDHILLEMDIPGFHQEDLNITVENNVLTVSGERKPDEERKQDRYQRNERFFGSFSRTFTLPATVDPDHIEAKYENGVLYLTMPKKAEAKPRQIKIGAPVQKQLTGSKAA